MVDNTRYKPANEAAATNGAESNTAAGKTPLNYTYKKFPSNLGESTGQGGAIRYPHFMVFYINVNSKSSLGKDTSQVAITDLTQRTASVGVAASGTLTSVDGTKFQSDIKGTKNDTGLNNQYVNATIFSAAGVAIGGLAAGTFGRVFGLVAGVTAGLFPGAITTAGNFIKDKLIPDTFKSSKKRLLTAIMLPMPVNVSFNTRTNYDTSGLGGVAGTLLQGFTSGQAGEGLQDVGSAIVQQAPKHLLAGLGAGFGKALAGNSKDKGLVEAGGAITGLANSENFKNVLSKLSGLAENPRSEQVFKSVAPREFQFQWLFAPRSEKESNELYEIIQLMKSRMLPELDANNTFLIMPDEWDIEIRFNDKENDKISKIATSVLTAVDVNYSPNGHFNAFAGTGNPTMIQLSLSFVEVEPLLRQMVEMKGF